MTQHLQMPESLRRTDPADTVPNPYTFDHVPSLRELLPKHRGMPGYQYVQCTVHRLARAQLEKWVQVNGSVFYRIQGPRGYVDMALMVRGKRTPGQPSNSGARLCFCDDLVLELTGNWINPHEHTEPYWTPEAQMLLDSLKEGNRGEEQKSEEDAGLQSGSVIREAVQQDSVGQTRAAQLEQPTGSREGGGDPSASTEEPVVFRSGSAS